MTHLRDSCQSDTAKRCCARCGKDHTNSYQGCEAIKAVAKAIQTQQKAEAKAAKLNISSYAEATRTNGTVSDRSNAEITALKAVIKQQEEAIASLRKTVDELSSRISSRHDAAASLENMELEEVIGDDDSVNGDTDFNIHAPLRVNASADLISAVGNALFPQFEAMFLNFFNEARSGLNSSQPSSIHHA